MRTLKKGAIIASASSKQIEFDMDGLRGAASSRRVIAAKNSLVRLPVARYRLDGKSLTVLGDGWPVNFDGDVEVTRRELIQLTRGLLFEGALQAAAINPSFRRNQRVLPFDAATDEWLLSRFRVLKRRKFTSFKPDPGAWVDVIRTISKTVREAGQR